MKNFYSYSNENGNYTKAVSLKDVRSIRITENSGKSAIRFNVHIDYRDDKGESFYYLKADEAKKVYIEILKFLNEQ